MIGEDRLIRFSGCKSGEACTIVLRGASTHVLEEAERSLHDALCVLSRTVIETRTIPGGGCCEVRMAKAIDAEVFFAARIRTTTRLGPPRRAMLRRDARRGV